MLLLHHDHHKNGAPGRTRTDEYEFTKLALSLAEAQRGKAATKEEHPGEPQRNKRLIKPQRREETQRRNEMVKILLKLRDSYR